MSYLYKVYVIIVFGKIVIVFNVKIYKCEIVYVFLKTQFTFNPNI